MQLIQATTYRAMPWANGRGMTQEIARVEEDGRLLWRLSLAEVNDDGAFSLFPGLMRWLTVIDGAGMSLHGATHALDARHWEPLYFSGDEPLDGRLTQGPVRDLNLIFDPTRIAASATVLTGPAHHKAASLATLLWLDLNGTGTDTAAPGDTLIIVPGEVTQLPQGTRAVVLGLDRTG